MRMRSGGGGGNGSGLRGEKRALVKRRARRRRTMMKTRMTMATVRVPTLVRRSTRNGRRRHRLEREWRSRWPPLRRLKTARVKKPQSPTGLKLSPVSATSPPPRRGPSTPLIASPPSRNSTPCPVKERQSSKSLGDGRVSKKGKGGHRIWRGW